MVEPTEKCQECGSEIISYRDTGCCPNCGAPVCCPKCCSKALEYEESGCMDCTTGKGAKCALEKIKQMREEI
jgi:hypothetical protein